MLAAKAIQDWMLYAGQESSTRFLDFAKQPFLNPTRTEAGINILENWRRFYLNAIKPLQNELRQRFPILTSQYGFESWYLDELPPAFVHPTLRRRALQMAEVLVKLFGHFGLSLDLDEELRLFDVRRGTHDIVLFEQMV